MNFIKKAFAFLCLSSLIALPCAQAQHGKVIMGKAATPGGIHANGEPTISGSAVYVFGINTTYNSQPTSLVDCSLVGVSGYSVYQDANYNCYVEVLLQAGQYLLPGHR